MLEIPELSDYDVAYETLRDAVRQIAIFHPSEQARDDAELVLDNVKLSTMRALFSSTEGTVYYPRLILAWRELTGLK